ncbi:hypothetical protein [Nocardia asiatica]|uniref:hypothetical protein n=1 Tax=Nocardia asiatica TaxID=209252 RepID=UPI000308F09F|nr:hypothetical protein [Nocardia asiatica]
MITANHAVPTVNSGAGLAHAAGDGLHGADSVSDDGAARPRSAGVWYLVDDPVEAVEVVEPGRSASAGVAVSSLDTRTQMRAGVTDLLLIGPITSS